MENELELIDKLHRIYGTETLEGLIYSLSERIDELEEEIAGYIEDDGD